MKPVRLCILALALLSLAEAACSPRMVVAPPLLSQVATPQPTPRASDFPRGRFVSVSAPGMVTLFIENDGRFRLLLDNDRLDSGKFDIDGGQALVDSLVCAERGDKPAPYYWLYDDEDGLAFRPVATDPCLERRQYLSETYVPKYLFVLMPPLNRPDRGAPREWLW